MIQDRIAQIEARLASATDLPETTRAELQALVAELKSEVTALTDAHGPQAHAITATAEAAISKATEPVAEEGNVLSELRASVEGFEASHPRLVQVVDRLALTLSNMGI